MILVTLIWETENHTCMAFKEFDTVMEAHAGLAEVFESLQGNNLTIKVEFDG